MNYDKLRKNFLNQHPTCRARIRGLCSLKATDVHHMKGRGKYHLDTKTWVSVCRPCHEWIETHPEEAKELGLSKDRTYE